MTTEQSHKAEKFFPRAGLAQDGWSTEDEATATCYCGAVQMVLVKPLLASFSPSSVTAAIAARSRQRCSPLDSLFSTHT
ncbi:hypothetical protein LB505_010690 [Fusarium chuoi]|nr:hypothetical protein LB505_010690 [Fusarium chuoi]